MTRAHPGKGASWADVRAALQRADGVVASELYAGVALPMRDEVVVGLVPIGMNPVTKLWEFYELRSAWDGESDPATIEIPRHRPDGSIAVDEHTGVVFVLLPGGELMLGAQSEDESAPLYDPMAKGGEAVHTVTLSPFLLARHEMTQAQWQRPGQRLPAAAGPELVPRRARDSRCHRVEGAPRRTSDVAGVRRLLARYGMVLPTEAQWEYGGRGGTTTPHLVEWEQMAKYANFADRAAKRAGAPWNAVPWEDGFALHAPVGSFAANRFGLYDVCGNVWEWCLDRMGSFGSERPGDGLREGGSERLRPHRGGGYDSIRENTRITRRYYLALTVGSPFLGVRPARLLPR